LAAPGKRESAEREAARIRIEGSRAVDGDGRAVSVLQRSVERNRKRLERAAERGGALAGHAHGRNVLRLQSERKSGRGEGFRNLAARRQRAGFRAFDRKVRRLRLEARHLSGALALQVHASGEGASKFRRQEWRKVGKRADV
jgi:hypothetical protein